MVPHVLNQRQQGFLQAGLHGIGQFYVLGQEIAVGLLSIDLSLFAYSNGTQVRVIICNEFYQCVGVAGVMIIAAHLEEIGVKIKPAAFDFQNPVQALRPGIVGFACLAIRRQPHQFSFIAVGMKTQICREAAIEPAQRVRNGIVQDAGKLSSADGITRNAAFFAMPVRHQNQGVAKT